MKNVKSVVKSLFIAILFIGGINLFSSCDGCSRSSGTNNEGTETGNSTNGESRGTERPADNEGSGSTEGTNSGSGSSSDR